MWPPVRRWLLRLRLCVLRLRRRRRLLRLRRLLCARGRDLLFEVRHRRAEDRRVERRLLLSRSSRLRRDLRRRWLRSRRRDRTWTGEPILLYWTGDNDQKRLFETRDNGRITAAWAQLALKATARGRRA